MEKISLKNGTITQPGQSLAFAPRYEYVSSIGQGTFGAVAVVIDKQTQTRMALKKIKIRQDKHSQGIPVGALREISILKTLKHPNIVAITQARYSYEENNLYFVMEYHPYTLHDIIKGDKTLGIKQIKKYTSQMLLAVQYLHRKGIMHRDIKPQNILVSSQDTIKLCDFGQAKLNQFGQKKHTQDIATLWYRAPQILMGSQEYDQQVDMWAIGCIVAQMMLGKPLFRASSELGVLMKILQLRGTPRIQNFPEMRQMEYFRPSYPKFSELEFGVKGVDEEGIDLLKKLLMVNPRERISVQETLKHCFFYEVTLK